MAKNQVVEYTDRQENSIREKFMKFMRNKIIVAIASIVFGLILIIWQRSAVDSFVRILGIILAAVGVIFIIMYAAQKDKRGALLAAGIILAVLGAFFLVKPDYIVKLFPFIMGLVLAVSGITDLANAVGLPKDFSGKTGIIAVSLIIAAFGVLCMFHPGIIADIIIVFIGILLLANGIFDLVILVMQNTGRRI